MRSPSKNSGLIPCCSVINGMRSLFCLRPNNYASSITEVQPDAKHEKMLCYTEIDDMEPYLTNTTLVIDFSLFVACVMHNSRSFTAVVIKL